MAAAAMLALASGVAISLAQQPAKRKSELGQAVVKLLEERRSVLGELVKASIEEYRAGRASIDTVTEAQQQLLLVELDLAADHPQRVKLLEEFAALSRELVGIAEQRYKAGQASQTDILKACADRLKVEIELQREKQPRG